MSKRFLAGVSPCTLACVGLLALLAAHQLGAGISARVDEASTLLEDRTQESFLGEALEAGLTIDAEVQTPDRLAGLWTRYEGRSEGDLLRFWYFHGNGKGLYRYGRVGYSNTHSFNYSLKGDRLDLRFRKTGEAHSLVAKVEERGGIRSLSFENDPREAGAHYRFEAGPMAHLELAAGSTGEEERFGIDDRLWIDMSRYATGGGGFAMYQLQPAAIDGRGVGWFHEGDFDQWRTEALSYRINGESLELFFELNEELGVTQFELVQGEDSKRRLHLAEDPRDFWLSHDYTDGGRSFAGVALGPLMLEAP